MAMHARCSLAPNQDGSERVVSKAEVGNSVRNAVRGPTNADSSALSVRSSSGCYTLVMANLFPISRFTTLGDVT